VALKEVCLTPLSLSEMIDPKEATSGVVWHLRLKLKLESGSFRQAGRSTATFIELLGLKCWHSRR
jgi:hypothetical protein